jgi:hypothetical protein
MVARRIASWTPGRVVVAAILWIVATPILASLGLVLGGIVLALISRGQRFTFAVSLNGWATGLWLLGPPVLLLGAWLVARADDGRGTPKPLDREHPEYVGAGATPGSPKPTPGSIVAPFLSPKPETVLPHLL